MKSNGKSKHILMAALASLIVISTASASVMTGCGDGKSEQTSETVKITETQVVTNIVEYTYATDENGQEITVVQSDDDNSAGNNSASNSGNNNSANSSSENSGSEKSENSNSSNNSNSANNSNSSNNSNSQSGNSSDNNKSNESAESENSSNQNSNTNNNSSSSSKILTIDGRKANVGDTITCVYKLKTPENLENYQATITYDSEYVSVKSAELNSPASAGGILNFNLKDEIKFNGSNVSLGYNYTTARDFVTIVFEVKKAGTTKTDIVWEVATGKSGKAYVENKKPVDGLKTSKSYK